MSGSEAPALAETLKLLSAARENLAGRGGFRLRVLLDMIVLEIAKLEAEPATTPPPDTPDDHTSLDQAKDRS